MALLLNAGDTVSRSYSYTQPSPLHPSLPQGTGERTENLFDVENVTHETLNSDGSIRRGSAMNLSELIRVDGDYTVSWNAVRSGAYMRVSTYDDNKNFIARIAEPNTYTRSSYSNTHTGYIRINYENGFQLSQIQVNLGSTALPYEPYGYKIPISSASTTTPIYLGEVETTRRIRKLVFDGTENVTTIDASKCIYALRGILNDAPQILGQPSLCTHLIYNPITSGLSNNMHDGEYVLNKIVDDYSFTVKIDTISSSAEFKTYLQQQYAAGTPVTVWYVLATEETGIVNEPLRKMGDYADIVSGITIPTIAGADSFDVLTTLKPSEVTVNYKGWHPVQSVHERENGAWT